ncbi:sporulation transcription factor Spo0A [Pelotomaculum terephthalicicum JT]|uniref:sporulation transcription factor Spo0A n=1 Tax=Pelotomaculum TaxID=191373 RepID=UPI0009CF0278|nr:MULTISPECIES: sporulation transcription factor Spo0A [Pelotomaculum]MCG9968209.1 sporulation transcription factor Spo0A [Pelotomaculum terephthalicicum JT]OPX89112.1 MAG: Stage 0 sporulation protein A [Pelotomaculum sp. PtaB.Bin117]OPY59222.1 MAG: Stage 0 sporulation protein A [Pelotomaculum sp. PtaU1.Bin065]
MLEKKSIKVLIADDNREFCELLSSFIGKQDGLEIAGLANNGLQAIEMIHKHSPDVVVLDIIMPQLDGIGVLESLAGAGNKPKVIMLTAFGQDSITCRALELGADYFIIKPFDLSLLVERIRQLSSKVTLYQYEQKPKTRDLGTNITNIMHEMGIPAHVKGYHYLREAIIMAYHNTSLLGALTKELYPTIAEKFKSTPSKVERAIRTSIQLACDRGNIEMIRKTFRYTMNIDRGKPTNGQFISVIADRLITEEKAAKNHAHDQALSSTMQLPASG